MLRMMVTRVLTGLAILAAAIGAVAVGLQENRGPAERSFVPYLIVLLVAAPLGALAAGLATGGVRFVSSSEREHPAPREDERGLFAVPAFRSYLALRDSAAAAFAVFLIVGGAALVDYFGREPKPGGTAVLALLAWLWILVRLLWAVFKRTWVGRRLEDGRLAIRPRYPEAGRTLRVVFEQPVRTDVFVRAVDLTLIAERTTARRRGGKVRHKTVRVVRQRLRLPVEGRAWPGTPLQVEGAFEVSPEGVPGDGWLRWRIEARTRIQGPDYATRFPIGMPDEDDEDDEDEGENGETATSAPGPRPR
jgi:hypothetical protein